MVNLVEKSVKINQFVAKVMKKYHYGPISEKAPLRFVSNYHFTPNTSQ
jgi:hypothetical protein